MSKKKTRKTNYFKNNDKCKMTNWLCLQNILAWDHGVIFLNIVFTQFILDLWPRPPTVSRQKDK